MFSLLSYFLSPRNIYILNDDRLSDGSIESLQGKGREKALTTLYFVEVVMQPSCGNMLEFAEALPYPCGRHLSYW